MARVGGDEFAVLLGSHLDRGAVADMARDLIERMGKPVAIRGQSLRLGAPVGTSLSGACHCDLFRRPTGALRRQGGGPQHVPHLQGRNRSERPPRRCR